MNPTALSLSAFSEFVRAAPLGVVATVDPDGVPEAALVGFAVTESGDLLFNSPTSARKIANIGSAPRVAIVVGCAGGRS